MPKYNKGQNPNSRANLLKPHKGSIKTTLTIKPKTRELAAKHGDGNMSAGIDKIFEEMSQDKLFNQSPIFNQALTIMEVLSIDPSKASELQPRIIEVAEKMQSLQIEEDYKEGLMEGKIKPNKHGAYII